VDIFISGLDINGALTNQTITLQGQTKVTLDTALWRFNRAYNDNGTDLVGNIYIYEDTAISAGVPIDSSKVRGYISIDRQQTEQCIYTVPDNHYLFLDSIWSGISNKVSATAILSLHVREYGKVFRDRGTWAVTATGTGMSQLEWCQPRRYGPRTDLKLICEDTSANGVGIFGMFDGDLRDDRVEYR
jgi:hypothetical protein